MVTVRKDQRKEAGHYSGLNENKRSKLYSVAATCSLHTAGCRPPFLTTVSG
jgi:hypothetical protein